MSRNPDHVFLSYSTRDGDSFAASLRTRLQRERPRLDVWQDKQHMRGGQDWWQQIKDELDLVSFVLLAVTPGALASDVVRRELEYAHLEGLVVLLVHEGPLPDELRRRLPPWLGRVHSHDVTTPRDWQKLLADLDRAPSTFVRAPFGAEGRLPDAFVPRPRELGALKGLLLDPARVEPVAITSALHGAGGFGKTTLAAALCHDADIRNAFHDGILWVTLGEQPDLLDALQSIHLALTRERGAFADVPGAAQALSQLLDDRRCLIVVDDVWNPAHLRPFARLGRQCARLVTTRRLDVSVECGAASRVDVDSMTSDEATRLLAARIAPPPDLRQFAPLARRLGEWPLLLELANAQLRKLLVRGESLPHALADVENLYTRRGPNAFNIRNAEDRNQAVAISLEASLAQLDAVERERCLRLAVFKDDVDIPISAAAALWSTDEFEARETLDRLDGEALIKLRFTDASRQSTVAPEGVRSAAAAGGIPAPASEAFTRIHDSIRACLQSQLVGAPTVHAELVDAWGERPNADNRFAWRWIGYHLVEAGQGPELRRRLFDFRFLREKLAATDSASLIADCDRLEPAKDRPLALLQGALRLSAHVIDRRKEELATQLIGRLVGMEESELEGMLTAVRASLRGVQLIPRTGCLERPGGALLRTLQGHTDSVNCVALSPDGRRAVSASGDETLKVWDLDSGAVLRTLSGHSDWVTFVALSPDGRRAVSASDDETLKVWDLDSGAELRTLSGHSDIVNSVAISPDGRRAVSASDDKTLKVWDLDSGAELRALSGHSSAVTSVALSPDGRRAVSAHHDSTLKVWDLDSSAALHTLSAHFNMVSSVALSLDGRRAVSASWDDTLKVWDLDSGAALRTLSGHADRVNSVALSPDGRRAVSASWDNTLMVWDLDSGAALRTLSGHANRVNSVALSADGRRAVSASHDKTLKVWDLDSGAALRTLPGHSGSVNSVVLSPNGRCAVSASNDKTLKVWNLDSGAALRTLSGHSNTVNSVALSPDGRRAVSASLDNTLKVWDLESGAALRTLSGHANRVTSVALSPDGRRAVSSSWDKTLKVWDLDSGAVLRTLSGHSNFVDSVALSPDGRRAVSSSWDKTLKVWDLDSGAALRTLSGHSRSVISVALSPDGRRAVSASGDGTLKVWDLDSGGELRTLSGHSNEVDSVVFSPFGLPWRASTSSGHFNSVALSPDGRRAVSASSDDTLCAWDLDSGALLCRFTSESPVHSCAISSDGKLLVAGDQMGRVIYFDLVDCGP